jgi:hypothetical protein
VLENGISTATRKHASTRFVRELRHPPHVTCRTKKLASTPPGLAGAQPAAPAQRPPRPAGQRLGPRLGDRGAPRGAVPSIGLAAGARIVQAPGLPPAPAPDACRSALLPIIVCVYYCMQVINTHTHTKLFTWGL